MAKIQTIAVRSILGFRGKETIEVLVQSDQGLAATCKIPFGKSEGEYEARYLGADQAEKVCQKEIMPLLSGMDIQDQRGIDRQMIEYDGTFQKEKLGGNLMLGISIACARIAAKEQKIPFYRYIWALLGKNQEFSYRPSRLLCNLVEGGAHADNNLEFQEHLIIPAQETVRNQILVIKRFAELFLAEVQRMGKRLVFGDEGGWAGDYYSEESLLNLFDEIRQKNDFAVEFGLDVAANNIKTFEPKFYLAWYLKLCEEFPIRFIEDPFPEHGFDEFYQELYAQVNKKTFIAGDDLIVTNPAKIRQFEEKNAINAVIIKPDQVGTLTETLEAAQLAQKNNWAVAVSHRSQETTDDYLADLAIGTQADFVKFGYFYQGERLAKYNRLLEIEKGWLEKPSLWS